MTGQDIVIGVGCPRLLYAEFVSEIIGWANSSRSHRVGIDWEQTPNRVDWSYSRIIETAKSVDCDWLVLNDADVLPELPIDPMNFFARQDLANGFDVVCSPLMNVEGSFALKPLSGVKVDQEAPFEVEFCTGGHWWISHAAFHKLKPVSQFRNVGGRTEPLYFRIPDDTSEDAEMCRMFRQHGLRICADPRLIVWHLKSSKLPSLRKGMKLGKRKGASEDVSTERPVDRGGGELGARLARGLAPRRPAGRGAAEPGVSRVEDVGDDRGSEGRATGAEPEVGDDGDSADGIDPGLKGAGADGGA